MENHKLEGHPPLAPSFVARLLAELAGNDDFRSRFASDTKSALQELGLSQQAAEAALLGTSCLKVNTIASKEEIRKSSQLLQDYLTSQGTHTVVYCLEAGKTEILSAKLP